MKTCSANVHHMLFKNNDPLPLSEFKSDRYPNKICQQCARCREYLRNSANKHNERRRYQKRKIRDYMPKFSKYDEACFHCISENGECVRSDGHDLPHYDDQYLNRCMLAVARKFKVDPRSIPHNGKVIKWQSLSGE